MTSPDGSPARFDTLRPQRLAAPVTVYVEMFSAHPLERDAAHLYGLPDGYLDGSGKFQRKRRNPADKRVYEVTLSPEDGLYPLPYMSGYEGYSQSLVASSKVLAARGDVIRRFIAATRKAMMTAYDNPAQSAAAMKAAISQGDVEVFRAQIETTRAFSFNEFTEPGGLGGFVPAHVRKTWEWVARANGYPLDKLDPMSAVDTSFSGS